MRRFISAAAIATLICEFGSLCDAAEKRIDVAAIVTKKDAEKVLGEAVKDPEPRHEEGADGYYSRCNYYSLNPGKSLVLRVRQASTGQLAPAKQLEELMAGNDKVEPVSGLGDKAALASEGAEKGPSQVLMLYIAKGSTFITIGIRGMEDKKAALERARALGRRILAKL